MEHLRKLRFGAEVIEKVFTNVDQSLHSEPVAVNPIVNDAYQAYRSFVKDRFTNEMERLNEIEEDNRISRLSVEDNGQNSGSGRPILDPCSTEDAFWDVKK